MRLQITAGLRDLNHPLVSVLRRDDIAPLLGHGRQILVYVGEISRDVHWTAELMEQHPELRVVYLSPHPWASLNYRRGRCLLAPCSPATLNTAMLRRMVRELLAQDDRPASYADLARARVTHA